MRILNKIDIRLKKLFVITTLCASLGSNIHYIGKTEDLENNINIKQDSINVLEKNVQGLKNNVEANLKTINKLKEDIKEQNNMLLEKDSVIDKLKKDLKRAETKTSAHSVSRGSSSRSISRSNNISAEDRELMARLVEAEGGIEPYKGKIAIANVVLNRVRDSRYPDTIKGVIYQKHQYASVSSGMLWDRPTGEDCYKAVDEALNGVNVVPTDTISFWADYLDPSHSLWDLPITHKIGGHVFTNAY